MKYIPPCGSEEKLFFRRVEEMAKTARHLGKSCYSGFLTDREREIAVAALNKTGWDRYSFFGGFQDAERKLLRVFWDDDTGLFPIAALSILPFGGGSELTHRDYLGALLATGIERRCVGDIRRTDEGAVVYLLENILPHIMETLTSVGRTTVQVKQGELLSSEPAPDGVPERLNVASMRLDSILGAALHLSRSEAKKLAESGRVHVNHLETHSPDLQLCVGDLVSVLGAGRIRIDSVLGQTRKNRTTIQVFKYG